jgi:hypothetical protein
MNMPGFTAEASLGRTKDSYARGTAYRGNRAGGVGRVMPQMRAWDLGLYWACMANGGDAGICGFLAGAHRP